MASLIACKDKGMENLGPVAPQPTGDFELTTALEGNGLALSWSKPEDLAGELSYTVYLGDQKLGETAENSFSADIAGNGFIDGLVTVTDASGNTETRVFLADGPGRDYVYIPDPEFEQSLIDQGIDKEGTVNGKLHKEDVKGVKELLCGSFNDFGSIRSLIGIEAFLDIQVLYSPLNKLAALDLSKNVALEKLACLGNQLTKLDVSKNVNLTQLQCSGNQLIELDLSKNVNLKDLVCSSNRLTELDLSKHLNLTHLTCGSNPLTALDLSKNVNLKEVHCNFSGLTTLDVSKNVNLVILQCHSNVLSNLDVSKNVNLGELYCSGNQLVTLDLSKNVNLKRLYCNSTQLTALDLSKNVNLVHLYCHDNQLNTLDLSKNADLSVLYCYNNQLTDLDLGINMDLAYFDCTSNSHLKSICVADPEKAKRESKWEKDYAAEYMKCE